MAAQITFAGGEKIRVKAESGAWLAKRLSENGTDGFQGNYLYVQHLKDGGWVWVNPTAVAYVEDWPE